MHMYCISLVWLSDVSLTRTMFGLCKNISAGKSWNTTSLRNSQELAKRCDSLLCKELKIVY